MHGGANRGAEGLKGTSGNRHIGMADFSGVGRKGRLGVNITNTLGEHQYRLCAGQRNRLGAESVVMKNTLCWTGPVVKKTKVN